MSGAEHPITHFGGKLKVDQFIQQDKELLSKIIFMGAGYYATNIVLPMITPNILANIISLPEDCPIATVGGPRVSPCIYALVILNQPELTLPVKILLAESETGTDREMVNIWSEEAGKPVKYSQSQLSTTITCGLNGAMKLHKCYSSGVKRAKRAGPQSILC
ncbi:hypothetical protein N7508_004254 [Penicillium antarcticum]|uniref:uncharacterized protein n=1 Tax=Penicillium antarcticum TaxID=416450 RepID=UPI002396C920|nr:uncharacterized protein N7508_004254 [Penicillium antarcticum]KAJ5308875.1 hypothetical protein N7508_004254 [Penicillium antarcticum]